MNVGYFMPSPLGDIALVPDGDALAGAFFVGEKYFPALARGQGAAPDIVRRAREQLQEFFLGRRRVFDLPLRLHGTPFQRRVWQALLGIPYGTVVSYGELARSMGLGSGHSRAVGSANGRNPVSIIVPCHRVIGENGALTGYAAGLPRKQALLSLERAPGMALPLAF